MFPSIPAHWFHILRMLQDSWLCENEISLMGSGGYFSGVGYIGLQEVEMTATLHGWNETPIMLSIFIHKMPCLSLAFRARMQSGGGDFVAIDQGQLWIMGSTETQSVSASVHMKWYKAHMFPFYTTTATVSPMNSYILISVESERQSEEGADTDQPGRRRLTAKVSAAVCYFRDKLMAGWKGKQWLQIWSKSSWSADKKREPFTQYLSRWKCKIMLLVPVTP